MTRGGAHPEAGPDSGLVERLWLALAGQEARLASLESQLSRMKSSRSWRVTAPLRALSAWFVDKPGHTETRSALERTVATAASEGVHAGWPISGLARLLEDGGGKRQLLVDVTELALEDLGAGVQRVTRRLLSELLLDPPAGFVVVPVRLVPGIGYCEAREFLASVLGVETALLGEDKPVVASVGDRFIGLDFCRDRVVELDPALEALRRAGASITLLVHDVLPLSSPHWFPAWVGANFESWLRVLSSRAHGVVCISRHTAEELARALSDRNLAPPPVGSAVIALGADLPLLPVPRRNLLPERDASVTRVLTVGTIEPRKGHAQALDAFELLWSRGMDFEWVIVGRPGWDVAALLKRMRGHPEAGRRLHWLDDADDVLLGAAYRSSDILLAPSRGEGFGLPVAEAGRLGLRLVLRDLAVFREVAGDAATYFQGETPQSIVQALLDAQAAPAAGAAGRQWSTWAEGARSLACIVADMQKNYRGASVDGRGEDE